MAPYIFIFQVQLISLDISLFAFQFLVYFIFSLFYFFYFTPRHTKSIMSGDSTFYIIKMCKILLQKKVLIRSTFFYLFQVFFPISLLQFSTKKSLIKTSYVLFIFLLLLKELRNRILCIIIEQSLLSSIQIYKILHFPPIILKFQFFVFLCSLFFACSVLNSMF